jgi:hypothetical protein
LFLLHAAILPQKIKCASSGFLLQDAFWPKGETRMTGETNMRGKSEFGKLNHEDTKANQRLAAGGS